LGTAVSTKTSGLDELPHRSSDKKVRSNECPHWWRRGVLTLVDALYQVGYDMASKGYPWKKRPPGVDAQ